MPGFGICAPYEIDGDQSNGFWGHLKIGDQKVSGEERWTNKKAAKEGLTQRGMDVVKKIQASQTPAIVSQEPTGLVSLTVSWVIKHLWENKLRFLRIFFQNIKSGPTSFANYFRL